MLPSIGGSELIVLALVALIVVGPKDLPSLMRKVGRQIAKLKLLASDFRSSFDDMARQSELEELRREVAEVRQASLAKLSETLSAPALNLNIQPTLAEIEAGLSVEADGAAAQQLQPAAALELEPESESLASPSLAEGEEAAAEGEAAEGDQAAAEGEDVAAADEENPAPPPNPEPMPDDFDYFHSGGMAH